MNTPVEASVLNVLAYADKAFLFIEGQGDLEISVSTAEQIKFARDAIAPRTMMAFDYDEGEDKLWFLNYRQGPEGNVIPCRWLVADGVTARSVFDEVKASASRRAAMEARSKEIVVRKVGA